MAALLLLIALVASPVLHASAERETVRVAANPIRKVVNMLQALKAKVEGEAEKERKLHEKYMCYCKNAGGALARSIADAKTKVPELESAIAEATGKLAQLKEDVKNHKADRIAAKTAMAEATAVRQKEKAAYDASTAESNTNIAALNKAVAAIEKGMAGFLQTGAAAVLRKMVISKQNMLDADRQDVLSFLSGGSEYAPASGEIVGILKQMGDEMSKDVADANAAEAAAVTDFDGLMAAKQKEVDALTKMIEQKLTRVGNLGVEIQEMKNDLGDTAEGLEDDSKFLADLDKNCATKETLFQENTKMRGLELAALADTIKVLNDDDALELFKKTLPGASASFLQVKVSRSAMKARALAILSDMQEGRRRRPEVDFISLALRGQKIGFEQVIKMIDDLVTQLKQEQKDDEDKKVYCAEQFDLSDDKKKVQEKTIADLETAIAESEENIVTLKQEIDALEDGIHALDKSVAEATEQRKEEHEDYTVLMASDGAAKELIAFAKNRLNKFYNPKLYQPPPKRDLTDEERATLAAGGTLAPTEAPGGIAGTGVTVMAELRTRSSVAPPSPPEAVGAYSKKGQESNGIIAMMDLLIKDLDKEMTEAEFTEKDAQGDYEQMMRDSAEKRSEDSKTLTDKQAALAETQTALGDQRGGKASAEKELAATHAYISSLHAECDWLLKFFEMRKEARVGEIDALGNAKAVLSGADFSLIQLGTSKSRKFLGLGQRL